MLPDGGARQKLRMARKSVWFGRDCPRGTFQVREHAWSGSVRGEGVVLPWKFIAPQVGLQIVEVEVDVERSGSYPGTSVHSPVQNAEGVTRSVRSRE